MSSPLSPRPDSPLNVRMDDVAREAGVSRATVSRVLVGHPPVSGPTRERVTKALDKLGYVPNEHARGLAARRSDLVGLLLRDPSNPSYGALHAQIQRRAASLGIALVTAVPAVTDRSEQERSALQRMLGLRVGALIVSTGVITSEQLAPFLDTVPVVSAGRPEPHPAIDAVSYDEELGATMMAQQIVAAGHREIAVLGTTREVSAAGHLRGVHLAAQLRARGAQVRTVLADQFAADDDKLEELLRLVLNRQVTAIAFNSDDRALAFWRLARATGVRVPEDVSITGIDGLQPHLDLIGLATIRLPVAQVAERTVALVHRRMSSPEVRTEVQHQLCAGVFVAGPSLGPAPSPQATAG